MYYVWVLECLTDMREEKPCSMHYTLVFVFRVYHVHRFRRSWNNGSI